MAYYYAAYIDEYVGFTKTKRAETLKNALKGLRKYISDKHCESGVILSSDKVPELYERSPKNLVGTMYVQAGKKFKMELYGREVWGVRDDFYYIAKGKRKKARVLYDGTLR